MDTTPKPDLLLVHSSDLHIDNHKPGAGYHGLVGLAAVLDAARALCADLVLLAGDSFDNHRVATPVLRAAAALLADAPAPVVMLPGNHDPAMSPCLFERGGLAGLAGVHVLGVTDAVAVRFPALDLEVWGHAHVDHANMAPLRGPRRRSTAWQVALAHGHYAAPDEWAANAHRSWLIDNAALAATAADYIALGHWDRPARVGDGRVAAYYSGSPDLAHSVNVIRLGATGVAVDRHPIDVPSERVLSPAGRPAPG